MTSRFTADVRSQQDWGWLFAIYLFLAGAGAGLFVLYQALGLAPLLGLASLALVIAGGVFVLAELGNPLRLWRAILRPTTSWVSRGFLSVSAFLVVGALSLGAETAGWLAPRAGTSNSALAWIAAALALFITLYPGFVLGASRAIPFWKSPLLPLLFSACALGCGAAIAMLASPLFAGGVPRIRLIAGILIAIEAVVLASYVFAMKGAGGAAAESVRRLRSGALGRMFDVGVVGVGLLLPLIVMAVSPAAAPLAGALMLVGALLLRRCVLAAGVYMAPPIAAEGLDLRRVNRGSDAFAREYAAMAARAGSGRA